MTSLDDAVTGFETSLREFAAAHPRSFTVGELRADMNWPWGYARGVYCFVSGDDVVYVGRALGCTLGERVADQLRAHQDPAWAAIVSDDDTVVLVYEFVEAQTHLAAALEAYLIANLEPEFNLRLC